jgi:hypothetical protein
VSAIGGTSRIAWLGGPRPPGIARVRIAAAALAPGLPLRDLLLSPHQTLTIDGVPVRAGDLVNGATILQPGGEAVADWQLELAGHETIYAEGLATECFVAGAAGRLAPVVGAGPMLAAIRRKIAERARDVGWLVASDDGLTLEHGGRHIPPLRNGAELRFYLPPAVGLSRLRCATHVPAHFDPASPDHRPLGVAVRSISLDGTPIALTDPCLREGWHAPEAALRWTDGAAAIDLTGISELALHIANTPRAWPARAFGVAA